MDEKESLKLLKSDIKDIYFLHYGEKPIAAVIQHQDGVSIRVIENVVEAIDISKVSIHIKVKQNERSLP